MLADINKTGTAESADISRSSRIKSVRFTLFFHKSEGMIEERAARMDEVLMTEVSRNSSRTRSDTLVAEEPLEIRVLKFDNSINTWMRHSVAVTMRTPGNQRRETILVARVV
ncbi:MAG: hypothetical protein ACREBS_06525 [Nitrososphaerales archaeon]